MSYILKAGEGRYIKETGNKTTKYPELAAEFPTSEQARKWSEQFAGGELWEVWQLHIYLNFIPGV